MTRFTLMALTLLAAIPVTAVAQDRCEVRRDVDQQIDAAGLDGVLIDAAAGSLEVVGSDAGVVRVRGVLCASDEELAAASRLLVERRRDAAWIEADLAESHGWPGGYARMDLVVEMPRALAADIRDGSGGIVVRGIAGARIDDGSGGIELSDIGGAVVIDDGSGEIRVDGVGDIEVDDGSGSIDIRSVRGSVLVTEDGSGWMEIRDVTGDVLIEEDGSGSITVIGVGGDLTVADDGSGSISHRDVQGRVSIPDGR